jgi:hypothetical protein
MKRAGEQGARSFEGRSGIRKPLKYFIDLWIIENVMIGGRAFEAAPMNFRFVGSFQEFSIRNQRFSFLEIRTLNELCSIRGVS